jgi:hypothetical protein
MHPELALAIARARHQDDLRQSSGPHVLSNPRLLSWAARVGWRLLARPHIPLQSHRIRAADTIILGAAETAVASARALEMTALFRLGPGRVLNQRPRRTDAPAAPEARLRT